jgi:5-deoxy-glucuronate isomerase
MDATVPPSALPNDLPASDLLLRPNDRGELGFGPERAAWRYLGYAVHAVASGRLILDSVPDHETCVVIQSGHDVTISDSAGGRWSLRGRDSVFDDLPSAIWFPDGRALDVSVGRAPTRGVATVVVARAPRSGRPGVASEPIVVRPDDVAIETRGAGNATRQINHVIAPSFPADRLEVVEVLTPSGNWSSWPPHKHDVDAMPGEAVLEEIYHYRFRRPTAWAVQRVYRADRSRDAMFEVRDGDVVLVTDGYHPFAAAHGDDAYYLNALAGDRRTMACSFDPALDWVRDTWSGMTPDPRIPLVSLASSPAPG